MMDSVQSPTNVDAQMALVFRADRYDLGWFHLIGIRSSEYLEDIGFPFSLPPVSLDVWTIKGQISGSLRP